MFVEACAKLSRAFKEERLYGSRIRAGSVALALFCFSFLAVASENTLRRIDYATLPGNAVQISLTMDQPVSAARSFSTDNPARVIVDLEGVASGLAVKTQRVGVGSVQSVSAVEGQGRTRVVVNLTEMVPSSVSSKGNVVVVDVGERVSAAPDPGVAPIGSAYPSGSRGTRAASREAAIADVDFRRGPEGEGRVIVRLTDVNVPFDVSEQGTKVIAEFVGVNLPKPLMQRYDVTDFATPVSIVEARQRGKNAQLEIASQGEYQYQAYQTDDLVTIELRRLSKKEQEARKRDKQLYEGERLSLNFQNIEVRAVLQLLADFTGMNLVASDTVRGSVTLRLKNVPWDQALDIILKTRGLAMRQTGNVMMVAPVEEIAAREKLELEAQQQIEELVPLRAEYIQVNYAKASDLAELLKSEDNPLLTPGRGNVSFDDRTNTLLVQDTPAKLEEIRALIEVLDIPIRQVLIESRVVIATNEFLKDIGVRFGFNRGNSWNDDNFSVIAGGLPGHTGGTADIAPGIETPGGSGREGLMVNLPATDPAGAVNFIIGKVGSWMLQLELSALQREGRGEIISSPKVITSDQNKATIKQGLEIPYQSATVAGGGTVNTVQFKEAVLKLEVTPHITPDDRVIMDLTVNKDEADFARSVLGQPPIDTRSVETSVLVDNGETVVLGGVFEANKTYRKESVPFFGDLPVVGGLFRQRLVTDTNRELLVFVTPRILKDTLAVR